MSTEKKYILAIESAVAGGSLSLLREDVEIANWIGSSDVSKAEDLLFNIDRLLFENGISKGEIDLVAVSAGPGSFTGIRIGIATALGLKNGLGIEMSSESALAAMMFSIEIEGIVIAALPVGRDAVGMQAFQIGALTSCAPLYGGKDVYAPVGQPHTVTEDSFVSRVGEETSTTFLVHEKLYAKVEAMPNAVNFGANLAKAVGLICRNNRTITQPIFISKSF